MIDPLLDALVAADTPGVLEALRTRTEAERAEAARVVVPAAATQGRGWYERGDDGGLEWHEQEGYYGGDRDWRQAQARELAAVGTGSLKDLRGLSAWRLSFLDPVDLSNVLLDRRPTWLRAFVPWFLRAETYESTWPHVRPLIRAGLAERPADDVHLEGLLTAARREDSRAAALLTRDPALLDRELWELLAFNAGDDSLTAADAAGAGWAEAIIACANAGRVDRDRLLDAALAALASDISAYRSTWYTRLWRDLKPTPDERAARTDTLRALLGAAAAPVVGFAVEELARVKPVPPGLEHELAPALTASAKKTVRAALKLLDRVDSPDRAALATLALAHEDADVQGEVLDRLERWGVEPAALLPQLDLLAATQRPRAEALLGLSLPAPTAEPPDLDARIAALPEEIKTALRFGGDVPEAPIAGEPVLGEPIAPIATPDELAAALGAALLEPWQCRDERLLDAILRRCDEPYDGPYGDRLGPWTNVTGVAHAWLARTTEQPDLGIALVEPDAGLLSERVRAAATRAAAGKAGPLLALPTHVGGWIEPAALVARLSEVGEDVDEPELMQALLRLAPEGRATALAAAAALPGRPGALLCCALGGAEVRADGRGALAARVVRDPPLDPRPEVRVRVEHEPATTASS